MQHGEGEHHGRKMRGEAEKQSKKGWKSVQGRRR